MSERKRFLGGAAAGLFLAVAIVAAINLGTASVASPFGTAGTAAKTFSSSTTTLTSTTTSTSAQMATPSNLSSGGSASSRPTSSTATTNAAASQTTSVSQVPPSQMDSTSTTGRATSNPGISIASLIQTFPAIAIALVLGIAVYQFSVRRVDRTDATDPLA